VASYVGRLRDSIPSFRWLRIGTGSFSFGRLTFGPFESLFGPESVAMPMLRFLLADDHEVVRRGLRSILESQPDCDVVGEAADGRRAVALTKELNPDVVILDITMPALNGLEALRQILRVRPGTKVLVVTMHDSNQMITQVLNAGARGYILKSDATRDLLAAVELLRLNKPYFTTPVSEMLLDGFLRGTSGSNAPQSGTVKLSPRQREIVQLLAEGRSSKEVAVALHVAVKTAETHRANIMRRLGCHSITELVRYAIRNKIIEA
jgi:DNA-binding NarL/FixJ family response regulator